MNKKRVLFVIVIVLILILAILGIFFGEKDVEHEEINPTESTAQNGEKQETQLIETTMETIEGIEEWDKPVETTEETTAETTEPEDETDPTEKETDPTTPTESERITEYEWYLNLSPQKQQEYFESFDNPDAFFAWFNNAKAEYEASREYIDINGNPNIDLGEIVGSNG